MCVCCLSAALSLARLSWQLQSSLYFNRSGKTEVRQYDVGKEEGKKKKKIMSFYSTFPARCAFGRSDLHNRQPTKGVAEAIFERRDRICEEGDPMFERPAL